MIETLRTIALRLALCGAATWLAWKAGMDTGVLFMAGVFGIALARPLVDLASDLRHAMRQATWRDVEGRHYAFRGVSVRVHEDPDRQRWVRLADIRRLAGFTSGDAALQVTYPAGFRRLGRGREPHLSDEALLAHLAKERSPEAARLRVWVEREIVFPARRERERLGIRLDAPDFRGSD